MEESASSIFNITILRVNPMVQSCDIVENNQSSTIIMGDLQPIVITNETEIILHTESVIYIFTISGAVVGGLLLLSLPVCWYYRRRLRKMIRKLRQQAAEAEALTEATMNQLKLRRQTSMRNLHSGADTLMASGGWVLRRATTRNLLTPPTTTRSQTRALPRMVDVEAGQKAKDVRAEQAAEDGARRLAEWAAEAEQAREEASAATERAERAESEGQAAAQAAAAELAQVEDRRAEAEERAQAAEERAQAAEARARVAEAAAAEAYAAAEAAAEQAAAERALAETVVEAATTAAEDRTTDGIADEREATGGTAELLEEGSVERLTTGEDPAVSTSYPLAPIAGLDELSTFARKRGEPAACDAATQCITTLRFALPPPLQLPGCTSVEVDWDESTTAEQLYQRVVKAASRSTASSTTVEQIELRLDGLLLERTSTETLASLSINAYSTVYMKTGKAPAASKWKSYFDLGFDFGFDFTVGEQGEPAGYDAAAQCITTLRCALPPPLQSPGCTSVTIDWDESTTAEQLYQKVDKVASSSMASLATVKQIELSLDGLLLERTSRETLASVGINADSTVYVTSRRDEPGAPLPSVDATAQCSSTLAIALPPPLHPLGGTSLEVSIDDSTTVAVLYETIMNLASASTASKATLQLIEISANGAMLDRSSAEPLASLNLGSWSTVHVGIRRDVGGAPTALQDAETQFPSAVYALDDPDDDKDNDAETTRLAQLDAQEENDEVRRAFRAAHSEFVGFEQAAEAHREAPTQQRQKADQELEAAWQQLQTERRRARSLEEKLEAAEAEATEMAEAAAQPKEGTAEAKSAEARESSLRAQLALLQAQIATSDTDGKEKTVEAAAAVEREAAAAAAARDEAAATSAALKKAEASLAEARRELETTRAMAAAKEAKAEHAAPPTELEEPKPSVTSSAIEVSPSNINAHSTVYVTSRRDEPGAPLPSVDATAQCSSTLAIALPPPLHPLGGTSLEVSIDDSTTVAVLYETIMNLASASTASKATLQLIEISANGAMLDRSSAEPLASLNLGSWSTVHVGIRRDVGGAPTALQDAETQFPSAVYALDDPDDDKDDDGSGTDSDDPPSSAEWLRPRWRRLKNVVKRATLTEADGLVSLSIEISDPAPSALTAHDLNALVSVQSPSAPPILRPPIDLVAVIDTSGSMQGLKLDAVRESWAFLVRQGLREQDRLGLVCQALSGLERGMNASASACPCRQLARLTFEQTSPHASQVSFYDETTVHFELTEMNQLGKSRALPRIMSMQADGKTDLSRGLREGIRLIRTADRANTADEADVNEVQRNRALMVFTDGKATRGIMDTASIVADVRHQLIGGAEDVSIFTFGFGADHFPTKLHAIASATNGLYYFIENTDAIAAAFADCLAGLGGMVAQEAELELRVDPKVASLQKINFPNARFDAAGRCTIPLGTLYAQEDKSVLLNICMPAAVREQQDVKTRLLSAKLRYLSAAGKLNVVKATKDIVRPTTPSAKLPPPQWLELHSSRMAVVNSIMSASKLANRGDIDRARDVLKDAMERIRLTTSARLTTTQQLLADMHHVAAGYRDLYAYEDVGRQRSISTAMAHLQQRSSHTAGAAYEFSLKAELKSKWLRAPMAPGKASSVRRNLAMARVYQPAAAHPTLPQAKAGRRPTSAPARERLSSTRRVVPSSVHHRPPDAPQNVLPLPLVRSVNGPPHHPSMGWRDSPPNAPLSGQTSIAAAGLPHNRDAQGHQGNSDAWVQHVPSLTNNTYFGVLHLKPQSSGHWPCSSAGESLPRQGSSCADESLPRQGSSEQKRRQDISSSWCDDDDEYVEVVPYSGLGSFSHAPGSSQK